MISTMTMPSKTQPAESQSSAAQESDPQTDNDQSKPVVHLRNIYWRKLIQEGISSDHAKHIANGIANFDANQTLPTPTQRQLIGHYCTFIARAQLWRLELLMGNRKK